MKKILLLYCYIIILFLCFAPLFAQAAQSDVVNQAMNQVQKATEQAELADPVAPQSIIADVIRRILSLTGALFMVLIVYGGYIYVTAHGEDEQVQKGTKIVTAAIIGIVVVLIAYSITMFIGSRVGPMVTEGGIVPR